MTTPAVREHQSPLEAALLDVQATLTELLVAADAQQAAVVERDRDRLESVTRQQERLAARLARGEATRLAVLDGAPLAVALAQLPRPLAVRVTTLSGEIATAVTQLKQRQGQTASLLQQSIELASQTLGFLQRLVSPPSP